MQTLLVRSVWADHETTMETPLTSRASIAFELGLMAMLWAVPDAGKVAPTADPTVVPLLS